jgi:hypothetical protein
MCTSVLLKQAILVHTSLTSALFLLAPFMQGATVSVAISAPLVTVCRLPLSMRLMPPLGVRERDADEASGPLSEFWALRTELSMVWWLDTGVWALDIDFIVCASDGFAVRMLFATAQRRESSGHRTSMRCLLRDRYALAAVHATLLLVRNGAGSVWCALGVTLDLLHSIGTRRKLMRDRS